MAQSLDDIKKLKVQELRDELQKRNLETSGLKATLIERLEEALKTETAADPTAETIPTATLTNGPAPIQPATEPPSQDNVSGKIASASSHGRSSGFGELARFAMQAKEALADASLQAGKIVFEDSSAAEMEKRKARAARFGVPLNITEDKRKDLRAQRFGIAGDSGPEKRKASEPIVSKKAATEEELAALLEKKKARAARFNVPLVTTGKEEQLRLKSRAERFKEQLSNAPISKANTSNVPKTAAAAEFEAKKKARAERFKVTG